MTKVLDSCQHDMAGPAQSSAHFGVVIFNHHYREVLDCFYDPSKQFLFMIINWRSQIVKLTNSTIKLILKTNVIIYLRTIRNAIAKSCSF